MKLKVFGLENVEVDGNVIEEEEMCESEKFQLEIEHCNLRSNITQIENSNKTLIKEIEKYKNSIQLLNE